MLLWLILSAGLTATMFSFLTYRQVSGAPALAARFGRYAVLPEDDRARGGAMQGWIDLFIKPLAPHVERLLPGHYLDQTRNSLRQAGFYGTLHFQIFLVAQASSTTLTALAGAAAGHRMWLVFAVLAGMIGFLIPIVVLKGMVRRRQANLNAVLPDTIDLLTACVEAGLGLDAAIAQLVRRRSPQCRAINQELNRYLQELQIGVGRSEALRALGARSGVEDLRHVVTALVHGDALGVGVSQILRAQAQHLRLRRKQRAEEKAMKAPIKILFPLLFGIFPSIFVLILGPAVLRLYDAFAGKY